MFQRPYPYSSSRDFVLPFSFSARGLSHSPVFWILASSAFIAFTNNLSLWAQLSQRLELFSFQGLGYMLSIFMLIVSILVVLISVLGMRKLLKPVLVFLFLLSAVLSYFTKHLGVVFDQ